MSRAFELGYQVGFAKEAKNWIQGAVKKPGALHKSLGVPQGKKIPAKKLQKAEHAGGKLGQRARFAATMRGLNKKSASKLTPEQIAKLPPEVQELLIPGRFEFHVHPDYADKKSKKKTSSK